MIAYIDSSVVLRIVLEEEAQLAEWNHLEGGVASPLLVVECHRTLDRHWRQNRIDEAAFEQKRAEAETIARRLQVVPLNSRVLRLAAQPFPAVVSTLDALHLVSAMLYRATQPPDERPLLFATHDRALARAAQAMNFEVIGVSS